jgi:asparagine N-glycosylation enzyme membrane subunit Stt3
MKSRLIFMLAGGWISLTALPSWGRMAVSEVKDGGGLAVIQTGLSGFNYYVRAWSSGSPWLYAIFCTLIMALAGLVLMGLIRLIKAMSGKFRGTHPHRF